MTRRLAAVMLAVFVAMAAAACGGDDEDGGGGGEAGGEPITIGGIFDLSGATADVGTPYADGVKAYVEWVNANGGIEGRTINLVSEDYAYDVARAERLYSRLKSDGAIAIQGWGTGDTEALRGRVTTDELPFMSASYAETLVDPAETPYNFVVATTYSDQMRIALKWIAEDAGGRTEVAVFHHDSPFGEAPLEDGEAYIEEEGLDLGYETYAMPTGATDYVSELSRARGQGAKYIVIQNVSSPAAQLAKDVQRQGLDAKIVCLNWCGDELFVDLAGDAAEGVVAVMPFAPATADVEGLDQPREGLGGGNLEEEGVHFVQGWYTMAVMAEGLRQALEDGDDVDGPALKTALEEIPVFETGDVSAPIDFTAESHAGMQASKLFEVKDGVWAELTDFMEP